MPRSNAFKAGIEAYRAALSLTACTLMGEERDQWEAGWIKAAGY